MVSPIKKLFPVNVLLTEYKYNLRNVDCQEVSQHFVVLYKVKGGVFMNYNKRLKDLREDNDLLQEDIAKVLNTTKQSYSNYERGYRKLNIEDLIKLSQFYKVSTDYILGLTDNPEPNRATVNKQVTISGKKNKVGDITIK